MTDLVRGPSVCTNAFFSIRFSVNEIALHVEDSTDKQITREKEMFNVLGRICESKDQTYKIKSSSHEARSVSDVTLVAVRDGPLRRTPEPRNLEQASSGNSRHGDHFGESRILSDTALVRDYLVARRRALSSQHSVSVHEEREALLRYIDVLDLAQTTLEKVCQELVDAKDSLAALEEIKARFLVEHETLIAENYRKTQELAEVMKINSGLNKEIDRLKGSRNSRHFKSLRKFTSTTDMAKARFVLIDELNVTSGLDKNSCRVTGCVLASHCTLALADCNNSAVKILDVNTNTIVEYHQLPAAPWDITALPNDELAVTLQLRKEIQIISKYRAMFLKVDGDCRGIDFLFKHNSLVVSYVDPEKVEILDLQGVVLKSFTFREGNVMFLRPHYVCSSSNEDYIFVSDTMKHTITKLSVTGDTFESYSDPELAEPEGLCSTSDGGLLVCSYSQNYIHLVSKNLERISALLSSAEGIEEPQAIYYDWKTNKLYVALYKNNIKVFTAQPSSK
ncbi:hypothetical protein DPMN_176880 [Dreissena polymorpha]|uniref:Uncharacterized protein n=2 Tax=Dreissena polymorpha TaxID=45954 RepID=A0A9D4IK13_DREPO|nr:hypothetical protein DPMN_176880 [Dreissena polymorpha]